MRITRTFLYGLALLVAVGTLPAAAFEPAPEPAVAYGSGDDTVVATATGSEIVRIPLLEEASLDGNVVAGIGPGGGAGTSLGNATNAYDATTGEFLWIATNTKAAIVLDEGARVALLPDNSGIRDPQNNSIWMREPDGSERLVVQFANGKGLPGYDPRMDGLNHMLSASFDDAGEVAVVSQGNDWILFIYDIFAVDVATGEVTRLTAGMKSRWPAVSPNGTRVAYQIDLGPCETDVMRASDLMLIGIDGRKKRLISSGSCDSFYNGSRWISNSEIVVAWLRIGANGQRRTDLVMINVDTGKETRLTRSGNAWFWTVDSDRGVVAYSAGAGATSFTMLDVHTGEKVEVTEDAGLPHMSGDHQWP